MRVPWPSQLIPTVRLEEEGNGAGAINGAREMEATMKKWQNGDRGTGETEMEKWRRRNGNQDEKEMETSAEEKWKTAPTRNENNCYTPLLRKQKQLAKATVDA